MGKVSIQGLEDFQTALVRCGDKMDEVMAKALYGGMERLMDEVKANIQALPVQDGYLAKDELPRHVVTRQEKEALLNHIGIAHFDAAGGRVSSAIGFEGYTPYKTRAYPNGLPIPMVARAIESGSSVRDKHPFMRKAANGAKAAVVARMEDIARQEIQKITEV